MAFLKLHAWSVLNCTCDLFSKSSKSPEKMQPSSLSTRGPCRSHFSRSVARVSDKSVKMPETRAIHIQTVVHARWVAVTRVSLCVGACFSLLLFRDGAAWCYMPGSSIKRKSAPNMLLCSLGQTNPLIATGTRNLLYIIRWLKSAWARLSSTTLRG